MRTTSSIEARAVQTSSGTASPSVEPAMTEFTQKAGERGVLDSTRSLGALLLAMVKHPFGIHDWAESFELVDDDLGVTGEPYWRAVSACWLCQARDFST